MDTLKPTPKRKRSLTAFISPSKEIIRSPSKQRSVSDLGPGDGARSASLAR